MSTNINDLPCENISLEINENGGNNSNVMNEFVSGIQQAVTNDVLKLPSRDIPQSSQQITHDNQSKEDFIPKGEDYITHMESNEQVEEELVKRHNKRTRVNDIFDEAHLYVLLAILYFFFQLPFVHKTMLAAYPTGFNKDGNLNFYGILVKSAGFTLVFYIIYQGLDILQSM